MPVYQVVRCAGDRCRKYQTQQEKKSKRWACVVCGLKQSLKRVYFESAAPRECRAAVMDLNMKQGLVREKKEQMLADMSKNTGNMTHQADDQMSRQTVSKWAEYSDDQDETRTADYNSSENDNDNDAPGYQGISGNPSSAALQGSIVRSKIGKQTVKSTRKMQISNSQSALLPTSVRHKPYQMEKSDGFKSKTASAKEQGGSASVSQALSELILMKARSSRESPSQNSSLADNLQHNPQREERGAFPSETKPKNWGTAVGSAKQSSKWNEFESSSETDSDSS